ncbi:MAG: type transport system permease protein [Acidimicrobiaceae bacterium]|nr:type transport system permease protein [Acidimicrobiaceae bacterium]
MTAFLTSLAVTAVLVGIVVAVGKRRAPGTPLTWGEAFIASVFVFGLLLMIYGVVPDRWLRWADGELKWRTDAIGIPLGPLGKWFHFGGKKNVLFGNGVTFGNNRGRIIISKSVIRDIIAATLYIVFGLGQIFMWKWWQSRGKAATATPELETSAYGRPLVRRA